MINISILEVPFGDSRKLKDTMYYTAQPLYQNKNIDFEALHKIVSSDFRQYSPFTFKNSKKTGDNWGNENQNILILDIDDGLTITEAKDKFKAYKNFICTTKSHRIEKKGVVCDRFRVILQAVNVQKGDDYFKAMRQLEKMFPFVDPQVNTKTGAFLGSSKCEYWYNDGVDFDMSILKTIKMKEHSFKTNRNIPRRDYNQNNDTIPIQDVKSRLTQTIVADVITSLGYEVNAKFMFKARAEERTPSAGISKDCYVNDFGGVNYGDVFGFITHETDLDFKQSIEYVGRFV